jgi:anti-anti-sigma factor
MILNRSHKLGGDVADSEPQSNVGQPPLSVTVSNDGEDAVVTVRGEIDLETSAELSAVLADLDADSNVSLDLGDVTYIDSTGLRVLLTARDAATEAGGGLRVSATSSIVARLIEITGASDLLGS